jgi:membrane protein YfhO
MGGVDYVLSLDPWPDLEPVTNLQLVFASTVKLYRVPDRLARAYVVGRARLASEPDSVHLLADPTFDPRREVILPATTPVPPAPPAFDGDVRTLWRRGDSLGFATTANAAGYLVVLDTFLPDWTATVDGVPAEVLRANVVFRAVAVPAGSHTVALRYRPRSVVTGLLVSGASLVFGSAYWALRSRRVGRPSAPTVDAGGATL